MTDHFPEEAKEPAGPSIPHSREAEEAVVGAVMINPESYYDVAQFLVSSDFYIHRHQWIWEAYTRLHEKRIPVDLLTLSEELDKVGQLGEIGGSAYLTSLVNQVPSSLNAESYGRIVEGHSIRRKMINAANKIASLAYKEDVDIQAAYAEGRKTYDDSFPMQGEFKSIRVLVSNDYDRIDERAKGKEEKLVPTGLIDLDKQLDGGLRDGDLMYIGGRPGQGKTAVMLDIAKNTSLMHKKRVAIFSLEMSGEQLTQRLLSKEGIPMGSIRTGKLEDREWPILTHAVETVASLDIYIDDTPMLRPSQFRAKAHTMYNRMGIDLIILDYVQLMVGDVISKSDNRNNELSDISRMLKIVARELHIPVIAGAQLNRKVEERQNKRPMLADLRDSGSLEQDADIIGFMYRDDYYNENSDKPNTAELNIAKHRNGRTGVIDLVFNKEFMKFGNAVNQYFKPNQSYNERQRVDIHGSE